MIHILWHKFINLMNCFKKSKLIASQRSFREEGRCRNKKQFALNNPDCGHWLWLGSHFAAFPVCSPAKDLRNDLFGYATGLGTGPELWAWPIKRKLIHSPRKVQKSAKRYSSGFWGVPRDKRFFDYLCILRLTARNTHKINIESRRSYTKNINTRGPWGDYSSV